MELDLPIETIVLDVTINKRKWAIIGAYRPPSMDNKLFTDLFTKGMDHISTKFDNILLTGDLNYDTLDKTKGATLLDLCDIFDLSNLIKAATCFMKNCVPSLVDVILTNQPRLCFNALNFGCGISDWHNMIGVANRGAAAKVETQSTQYRSYKNFDQGAFNDDVGRIPFHAAYAFEDIDDIYWAHERLLSEVVDIHAPIKERKTQTKKPSYMNGELRRAVYKKHMLFNKYKKCRTSLNWDNYRKQRNLVTKIKKQSMRVYFYERCAGGPKSKDFWPTIKPFLSKKGSDGGNEVILCENEKIVSDQTEVCNIFNKYFVNVAKDIGKNSPQYNQDFSDHPSIEKIMENNPSKDPKDQFSFKPTTETYVHKVISNFNIKKSTGVDKISAKILKACVSTVSGTISNLINTTYNFGKFPLTV